MKSRKRTVSANPPAQSREKARALARQVLETMTDAEDEAITAAAETDPDAQPAEHLFRRERGRPRLSQTKQSVQLRLDRDVVDAYRSKGPGWQTRMNIALRKAAGLE